MKKKSTAR